MDAHFFLKGMVIGFSIAAPVGPIGVLCIRRSLADGAWVGFSAGLGAATADAAYGCVAGFGLSAISGFLIAQQLWVDLFGGAFLCYLGLRTFLSRPGGEAAGGLIGTSGRWAGRVGFHVFAHARESGDPALLRGRLRSPGNRTIGDPPCRRTTRAGRVRRLHAVVDDLEQRGRPLSLAHEFHMDAKHQPHFRRCAPGLRALCDEPGVTRNGKPCLDRETNRTSE